MPGSVIPEGAESGPDHGVRTVLKQGNMMINVGGANVEVKMSDIVVPVGYAKAKLAVGIHSKRFFWFFVYLIFAFVYALSIFDIQEGHGNWLIYQEALGIHGTSWSDCSADDDANVFKAQALPELKRLIEVEVCTSCRVFLNVDTHHEDIASSLSNVSTDSTGDAIMQHQEVATLLLARGDHELLVEFFASALVPDASAQIHAYEEFTTTMKGTLLATHQYIAFGAWCAKLLSMVITLVAATLSIIPLWKSDGFATVASRIPAADIFEWLSVIFPVLAYFVWSEMHPERYQQAIAFSLVLYMLLFFYRGRFLRPLATLVFSLERTFTPVCAVHLNNQYLHSPLPSACLLS